MNPPRPLMLAAMVTALLWGCGRRNFANEADRLRAQVIELETRNRELSERVERLETDLRRARAVPESVPEDVLAALPRVRAIALGRFTHGRDDDGDGRPDRLVAYVEPADERGRFVQLAGELTVKAALLPADAETVEVAAITLAPGPLRDAYRSTPLGTHYTVECALDLPAGDWWDEALIVRAIYVDGVTGSRLTAERAVPIRILGVP